MTLQNAKSSYLLNFRMWFKNGLKAQKLLAQGICPFRACGAYMRNLSKIFIDKILFIIS